MGPSELLQAVYDRLSIYDNWCSSGACKERRGLPTQYCLFSTLGRVARENNTWEVSPAELALKAAGREILGDGCLVVPLNDGKAEFKSIPAKERHQKILDIILRAIEMSEVASGSH